MVCSHLPMQYYAASHSFATIAANDVGIPIYVLNEMLCHVTPGMHITQLYIKKDYRVINEANERVLGFVFREAL